jgi:glucosamine-6-phosphate deaminase
MVWPAPAVEGERRPAHRSNRIVEIIIQPTAQAASHVAADLIEKLLKRKSNAVLGLATGATMLPLYRELIRRHRRGRIDWRQVRTFNLDEYVGLSPQHPRSYHAFMREHLFRHVNLASRNTHLPDGLARDIPAACDAYERKIRAAGGIDLQLLGIGTDGHIGFNEPSSSLASRTRIKTLTARTRRDNARFFDRDESVPFHVITMGIGTILEARQCVVLAFGRPKAQAVAAAMEGPISAMHPASALQWHPSVKVCLDRAAASKLKRAAYYRWVYAHKPDWQR